MMELNTLFYFDGEKYKYILLFPRMNLEHKGFIRALSTGLGSRAHAHLAKFF